MKRSDRYRHRWVQERDPSHFQPVPNRDPRSWANFFFHGFVTDAPVGIVWYPVTSRHQRGRRNILITLQIYFCCQSWKTLESRGRLAYWMRSCARTAHDNLPIVTISVSGILAVSQRTLWMWNVISRTFAPCAPSPTGLLTPDLGLWVDPSMHVQ